MSGISPVMSTSSDNPVYVDTADQERYELYRILDIRRKLAWGSGEADSGIMAGTGLCEWRIW